MKNRVFSNNFWVKLLCLPITLDEDLLEKKITSEINSPNIVDVNRYPYLHIFDVPWVIVF